MRRFITNLISIMYTLVKFCLIKVFHPMSFKFSFIERFSPNVILEIERGAKIKLGKKIRAHSGCVFKCRKNGKMIINDNVSFNYHCMIFCKDSIFIDEGVEFGPGVKIYDHDHDYKCSGGLKEGNFITGKVIIGKNVWIGSNTIILRGTVIGDNSVIAAGSVVKGNVPADSLFVQKRVSTIKEA